MGLHPVLRIEARRKLQSLPLDVVPAPADAARVGLAFDGVQLVPALEPDPAGLPHAAADWRRGRPGWRASGSSGCPDAPPARSGRTAGRRRAARTPSSRAGRAPRESAPSARDHRGAVFWRADRLSTRAPAARVGAPDPGRRCRPGGPPPAGRAASVPGQDCTRSGTSQTNEGVRLGGSSAERGRLGIKLLPLLDENRYSRTSLPQTHRPSKDPSRRPFIPRLKIGAFWPFFCKPTEPYRAPAHPPNSWH